MTLIMDIGNKMFNVYSKWHAKIIKYLGWEFIGVVKMNSFDYIIWNYACNLIIWASNLANVRLRVDNKHTYDHIVDASIKTIKYLNGPYGGWIGP
jgi:hypothetical protein